MKIGHPVTPPVVTPSTNERASPSDPIKVGPADPTEKSAQVELSSTASTLRSGAAATNGDFDADKVARISASIQSGTFKPNPEAIADKLVANAQEVLSRVGKS